MMARLSRQAQAVMDEVLHRMSAGESDLYARWIATAALEAAANQLRPDHTQSPPGGMLISCKEQLLAIATELRSTT